MALPVARRIKRAWRALRGFEAAQASPQHLPRPVGSQQSPDSAMEAAHTNLRQWGRYLDENHDLAIGIIDDLVTNVVGTGIVVQPMPENAPANVSDQILELWEEWGRRPEVTNELPWGELQRVTCRAWLRDGEFFTQHVQAPAPYPWGPSEIQYRVEYLEADMVPMDDYLSTQRRGPRDPRHGILLDDWNRPLAYIVYLRSPHDFIPTAPQNGRLETKTVPAELMMHVKFARRWPQTRGVPITHGVIRRIQDIKEYEESERIAARVAASLCAYIRKSPDVDYPEDISGNLSHEREMQMQSGQIFPDLLPGEEIGTIDTSRPSSELANFRESQMRALAAGTGTRYSSIARDYSGTYAAQRQEMVEARPHYLRLRNYYVERFVRPVYERWLRVAWLSGRLNVPSALEFNDLAKAEFIGPGMPWIDPLKEVQAHVIAIDNGLKTREQIIRANGDDPRNIAEPERPNLEVVENEDEAEDQSDSGTA